MRSGVGDGLAVVLSWFDNVFLFVQLCNADGLDTGSKLVLPVFVCFLLELLVLMILELASALTCTQSSCTEPCECSTIGQVWMMNYQCFLLNVEQ